MALSPGFSCYDSPMPGDEYMVLRAPGFDASTAILVSLVRMSATCLLVVVEVAAPVSSKGTGSTRLGGPSRLSHRCHVSVSLTFQDIFQSHQRIAGGLLVDYVGPVRDHIDGGEKGGGQAGSDV
jgi:hypothetical protein